MAEQMNPFGQQVGDEVPGWTPRARPGGRALAGRYCTLEPLAAAAHADDLFDAFADDVEGRLWTYKQDGPYSDRAAFVAAMEAAEASVDPLYYAVVEAGSGRAVGITSYLRITPAHGVIEIGAITYAPRLQQTPASTEASYLMLRHAFADLGYRRVEWKCDALNEPSVRAAYRLGFRHDGVFKQAMVVRGRNRDTAWFSMLDSDWPRVEQALAGWLAPDNFGPDGRQRQRLAAFFGSDQPALVAPDLNRSVTAANLLDTERLEPRQQCGCVRVAVDLVDNGLADDDVDVEGPGQAFQAAGQVDGVADHGDLAALFVAGVAQDRRAEMQADGKPHRRATGGGAFGVPTGQIVDHAAGTHQPAHRFPPVAVGAAEGRHHAVADIFVQACRRTRRSPGRCAGRSSAGRRRSPRPPCARTGR